MQAQSSAYLFGMVCAFVIMLPIGLAIGALILRATCALCRVEGPELLKGMGIVLLIGLANFGIGLVLGFVLGAMGVVNPVGHPQTFQAKIGLVGLPFQLLAAGSILSGMLETSFTKGVLIWVVQYLVTVAIVLVIVAVIFGAMMMFRSGI